MNGKLFLFLYISIFQFFNFSIFLIFQFELLQHFSIIFLYYLIFLPLIFGSFLVVYFMHIFLLGFMCFSVFNHILRIVYLKFKLETLETLEVVTSKLTLKIIKFISFSAVSTSFFRWIYCRSPREEYNLHCITNLRLKNMTQVQQSRRPWLSLLLYFVRTRRERKNWNVKKFTCFNITFLLFG